jgi:hypothetical protein
VAVLEHATEILEAIRSETARLAGEELGVIERTRLTGIKSLNSRDNAVIATTGSTDPDVAARAETDWRAATEDWERELQAVQEALFRSKSPSLGIMQLWALTRLFGASGFRAGVDVVVELLGGVTDPAEPNEFERWEMLPSLDAGEPDDVLPRVLGRAGIFGAAPSVDSATSIDRVVRSKVGDLQGSERGTKSLAALKQEVAAIDDERIVTLEALYRETSQRIEALQSAASRVGIESSSRLLEACRVLAWRAAEIIRTEAPELFSAAPAEGAAGAALPAQQGGGVVVDVANAENAYLIARERKMRELESIGSWFRRFEPHNPIGYVTPALVRRAGLDLPSLLLELCNGAGLTDGDRTKVFQALSVAEPAPPAEGSSGS